MKITEIPKGTSIKIVATYADQKIEFDSTVMLVGENIILIPPITHNGKTVGFNENFMLDLHYLVEGVLYRFPDVRISLVRYNDNLYHKIESEHEGKLYNRRGDYRVYIGTQMNLIANTAKGPTKFVVTLKDVSLSGFAFVSREEFGVERTVRLKFRDEDLVIDLPAKIVRTDWNEHIHAYVYGCRMADTYPALGQYLIAKQREILQKTRATSGGSKK